MTDKTEEMELKDRLSLIETMIAEGRRTTESWGWTFVFWGVAYYVAIAWTAYNQWPWAWLVTMMSAWVICTAIILNKKKNQPERRPGDHDRPGHLFHLDRHGSVDVLCFCRRSASAAISIGTFLWRLSAAMLGVANGASGMILRWKAQIASAIVWWVATVAACFGSR